jgi:hypothetical protein
MATVQGGWLAKKGEKLMSPQLPAEQNRSRRISAVHLEHGLRQIHADCANLSQGRLPQVVFNTSSWHTKAIGGVHPIGTT